MFCQILCHEKEAPLPGSEELQRQGRIKETAYPRAEEVSRNSGTTPFALCRPGSRTMSVMFAKLHFIECGYFPRGLLPRFVPMISPPGGQNIFLGRKTLFLYPKE